MAKPSDPGESKPSAREAKLAQALRANLRRRKVGTDPKPAAPPDPKPGNED